MRRKDRKVEDKKTIISILDTCKTASIAMIDQNTPYVLPLSYGYEQKDDSFILYFHCAKEGRKIESALLSFMKVKQNFLKFLVIQDTTILALSEMV